MAPFWHRWSDFSILNLSVFHLTDKCFAISNLINLRTILFLEYRKTPETLRFRGILRLDTMLSCDNKSIFRLYYSMIVATRPDPTVRPPSRYYPFAYFIYERLNNSFFEFFIQIFTLIPFIPTHLRTKIEPIQNPSMFTLQQICNRFLLIWIQMSICIHCNFDVFMTQTFLYE